MPSLQQKSLEIHSCLYSTEVKYQQAALKSHYATAAVFKDPMVSAEGRQAIASIFKALARVVSRITLTEIRVSESSSSGPRPYVVIDAVATYHFLGGLLKLPIRTLSRLEFDERGSKVLAHEDVWSLADLFSRLWVIGFLYNLFRSGLGALIGLLLG